MGNFTQKWYGNKWVKMLYCLILFSPVGFGRIGDCVELGDLQSFFWEGGKGGKSDDK